MSDSLLLLVNLMGVSYSQPPVSMEDDFRVGVMGVQYTDPGVVDSVTVGVMGVQYAIRADRRPNGERLSIAFTDGAEDDQLIYQDVIFPECLSYGTTVSPTYSTDKVEVASGDEQRNARLEFPRHVYVVEMENKTADEIAQIINIWHVVKGSYAGFMFMDPHDMTSAWSENLLAANEVSDTDQLVGLFETGKTSYELYKTYRAGTSNREARRRIKFPKVDTLVVAINGFSNTQWEWSFASNKLKFNADTQTGIVSQSIARGADGLYQASAGMFSNFAPGDLVFIEGWTDTAFNVTEGSPPARVRTVNDDGSEMVVERWNGSDFGSDTSTAEDVTITPTLPPNGAEITAGYWFYVPVRFDADDNAEYELTSGLRETAMADFPNITLRELLE